MKTLPTLAATALVTLAACAHAQDGRDEWPEGSAMHTLYVVGDELDAARATLDDARSRLLTALDGDVDEPSPLARAVTSQHESWLAYRNADCELAGALTEAGGAWPSVHGVTCRIEHLTQRTKAMDAASTCLRALPTDGPRYERLECLQGLVDWAMQGN